MVRRIRTSVHGPEFSRIACGTWRFFASKLNPQEINRRLHACLDLGITTIDTAEMYGRYHVEELVGKALGLSPGLRDKLELITKSGIYLPCDQHPEWRSAHYDATAARLINSVNKSLRLLRTDHVELFLVHRPDWLTSAADTGTGLNKLLSSGKIRGAGVSNYNVWQFDLLNTYMERPLATNQVEFSLLHPEPIQDGTLNQSEKLGISPMAWSPLAGGRMFDPSNPAAKRLANVKEIASRYDNAPLEQLAYAWILAHPSHPIPVIGTSNLERLHSAAQADSIVLDRQDWYALWEIAQGRSIP